mmetsp:Transcript_17941/g.21486  ORF Transcript_17941/g.21486 Transcript_17941/m.21486 type:complete len:509 (+) Transcript_17941:123-1649(+)|eukprot:CAMPEP_0197860558 /NCGR_PEP_ID=MMETSP1438-20131217/35998_1 /TAXON_ID=1461541 /ORGANISM="Pterosperma sp., Strain CCMP1384" /LENGTH=508 /DNA_ID=CAMNT_0043477467 /DNA_START=122 /DNA_END=1648 /DNA_ORIENTATION=+
MAPPKVKQDPEGVNFPKNAKGERSTTSFAKQVWGDAISKHDESLASAIVKEKDWRHKYPQYVFKIGQASMESVDACLEIASNGLKSIHDSFEFVRQGQSMKLTEAMKQGANANPVFSSGTIKGGGGLVKALQLPLKNKCLEGQEVLEQVQAWEKNGVVEPDVTSSIEELTKNSDWLDLDVAKTNKVFVLIGATSELCPFESLLKMGATVVAIARPSKRLARLVEFAKTTSGTLVLPVTTPQTAETSEAQLLECAGADVLTQTPELAQYLTSVFPGKQLVIGNYIYLDGEAHVRASVAMDAILQEVCSARKDTFLAYLGTPSIAYPFPKAAYDDALARGKSAPWWHGPVSVLTWGLKSVKGVHKPIEKYPEYMMINAFSVVQGPNYALAKTMQNWRCCVARAAGHGVSVNITPVAKTVSVMHVSTVAKAMNGISAFDPLIAFEPDTASKLMANLLVYDVSSPNAPALPTSSLPHPMLLLATGGAHSGFWRCPYTFDSLETASYLFGLMK